MRTGYRLSAARRCPPGKRRSHKAPKTRTDSPPCIQSEDTGPVPKPTVVEAAALIVPYPGFSQGDVARARLALDKMLLMLVGALSVRTDEQPATDSLHAYITSQHSLAFCIISHAARLNTVRDISRRMSDVVHKEIERALLNSVSATRGDTSQVAGAVRQHLETVTKDLFDVNKDLYKDVLCALHMFTECEVGLLARLQHYVVTTSVQIIGTRLFVEDVDARLYCMHLLFHFFCCVCKCILLCKPHENRDTVLYKDVFVSLVYEMMTKCMSPAEIDFVLFAKQTPVGIPWNAV